MRTNTQMNEKANMKMDIYEKALPDKPMITCMTSDPLTIWHLLCLVFSEQNMSSYPFQTRLPVCFINVVLKTLYF